jgi:2'-hydroxyisoflavone reductase
MGGRVLVPSPPERPVQFIHAADLAAWMLRMAERGKAGIYNATGPIENGATATPYTMEQVLASCRDAAGSKAEFVWVDERYLLERKVELWSDLPLATPAEEDGLMEVDVSRAAADGLTVRPLLNIVRETLAWDATRPIGTELKAGLKPAREAELLTEWDHPFA